MTQLRCKSTNSFWNMQELGRKKCENSEFFCFFARKQAFEADFGGKCAIFCDVGKNEVEKKQSRFLSNGESCWSAWASFLKNLQDCSLPGFAASFNFAVPSILYGKIWGQREENRHKSDKKKWCVLETAFSTLQNMGQYFCLPLSSL